MTIERKQFMFFIAVLAIAIMGIIFWSITSYDEAAVQSTYSSPFKDRQNSRANSSGGGQASPARPSGLREADIQKYKGRRYETY